MSSKGSFVQPLLRSKSFSYGALLEFTDMHGHSDTKNSISPHRYQQNQNRSLTSYEDIDYEDEQETSKFEERTPLLNNRRYDRQGSQTSNFSSSSKKSNRGGRLSQWITRITPPFLLPPDANLQTSFIRNGDHHHDEFDTEKIPRIFTEEVIEVSNYSKRDKFLIATIAAAAFCSTVVFSCIAPFFPEEAKKKGASETVTGFVFGIFELVIVLTAPIFGRFLTNIGSKFMYGTGLCVTGVTAILFGLLNLVPAGTTFIALAFSVRIVEAIGDSAMLTASFTIVAKTFTTRVATVIGLLETFSGLGFAAGPPIGGVLYEAGGFQLPFMVLGGFLVIAGAASFFLVPKQNDAPTKSALGLFPLLRMQSVWTMILSIITAAITISFLDPTLQPYLSDFNLSPVLVGLMFLILGGTYAISAPFWGYIIDRKNWANGLMLFGCACSFVSLLFIGPSPIFPFKKQLWLIAVSEIFMGLGLGALFIPPFQQCLHAAKNAGYPDTFETYGVISGIFHFSVSFGAFFGPTVGGYAVESMGFAWSTTALAMLHVICATFIVCLMVREKRKLKKVDELIDPNSESESSPFASHHQLDTASLLSESQLIRSDRS